MKKSTYIPNQHGAWSMLIMPFLFGMFSAQPHWLHALLFAGWLLVYLFSYAFLQWLRTKKHATFLKPMLLYGGLLIPIGILLLVFQPSLGWFIPLFIPLLFVNMYYAKRNRERAFLNDVAAIVQFSLMVFVAHHVGGGSDWLLAAELFGISVLYFVGTVFYVKTIIRERHNPKFYRYSVGYHLALLAAGAVWHSPWLLLPLAVLAVRAIWVPRANLSIKQTGILEFVFSALLTVTVLIIYTA